MKRALGIALGLSLVAASARAGSLVAYEPSINNEVSYVTPGGHTVTLWDDSTWQAATASDFAPFDAILIGESFCGDFLAPGGIWSNSNLWGPLVTGNILMHSHDDHFQGKGGEDNRYDLVIANCADFVTAGDGLGLCISIQCALSDHGAAPMPLTIPGIGDFSIDDVSGDGIEIVAPLHPAMDGLTDSDLDCWGSSTHAHIQSYPIAFELLATDALVDICTEKADAPSDGPGASPEGEDGSGPVTIARGSVEVIPTASTIGLGALALLLAAGAIVTLRRS